MGAGDAICRSCVDFAANQTDAGGREVLQDAGFSMESVVLPLCYVGRYGMVRTGGGQKTLLFEAQCQPGLGLEVDVLLSRRVMRRRRGGVVGLWRRRRRRRCCSGPRVRRYYS